MITFVTDQTNGWLWPNAIVQSKKICKYYLELSSVIVDSKNATKDQRVAYNRRVVISDRLEKSLTVGDGIFR